jgi:hypothetical protein
MSILAGLLQSTSDSPDMLACRALSLPPFSNRASHPIRVAASSRLRAIRSDLPETEWYRRTAEECRQEAEHASDPSDKASWLKLAEEWLKLAQEVEGGKKES